jgi:Flp pilus assembly protein TadG
MKQMVRLIRRSERGASLIETALVLPLLLLLVGGIVDLGGAFNSYIMVTNASREGARYASKFPKDATGIRNAAKQEASNFGISLADGDIVTDPILPGGAGTEVRVIVTFAHDTLLLGNLIRLGNDSGQITVSASTSMIVYGVPDGK